MSDLGANIRRIAGVDKIEKQLKEVADRVEILASRGIGYQNPDGSIGSTSGTPGTTTTPGAGGAALASGAVNAANAAAQQAAGSAAGGSAGSAASQAAFESDPTTAGITDSNDNVSSATELFDNFSNGELGSNLNGLTGFTDCASGKTISQLRLDGNYLAPDPTAATYPPSYITPWTEATTPPDMPGWFSGYSFTTTVGTPVTVATVGEAVAVLDVYYAAVVALHGTGFVPTGNYGSFFTHQSAPFGSSGSVEVTFPGGSDSYSYIVYTRGTAGSSLVLPLTQPKQKYWPLVASTQIAFGSAGAAASKYDSVAPSQYQAAQAALSLCFGAGRTATLEQNNLGGVNIFETDSGKGIGVVRVYNSNQELVGFTDQVGRYGYLN